MLDEPRRKTRYRGERCSSKLTLNSGRAHLADWRAADSTRWRAPRAAPSPMPDIWSSPETWIRRGNRLDAHGTERHALPRRPVRGPAGARGGRTRRAG